MVAFLWSVLVVSSVPALGQGLQVSATAPLRLESLPWQPEAESVAKADAQLQRGELQSALRSVNGLKSAAAYLIRARAHRLQGDDRKAERALRDTTKDPALSSLAQLERGLLAWQQGDGPGAIAQLQPLMTTPGTIASQGVLTLVEALAATEPSQLLEQIDRLQALLPTDDPDGRSKLLGAQAAALDEVGKPDAARRVRRQRFVEEPVSLHTPKEPPPGQPLSPTEILQRAERLLEAHRNERVIQALAGLAADPLNAEQRCRRHFAQGLAARKLHKYADAEKHLGWVVQWCRSADLARRAAYLVAKVISIRGGLRAIEPIEAFARRFASHSMVDDVLFWAGDLYQRRARYDEAESYYRRIEALPTPDDHCAMARWRLAWIAFRRGQLEQAEQRLKRLLADDGCVRDSFERARARYWTGRIAAARGDRASAIAAFSKLVQSYPLGFYAQQALARLSELDPKTAKALGRELEPPASSSWPDLCPDRLVTEQGFARGLQLLVRGLHSDAAAEFLRIELPRQQVLAGPHAEAQGIAEKTVTSASGSLDRCGRRQAHLLLALLLHHSGARRQAHWQLRTEFAAELARRPNDGTVAIWRAAYPLAEREIIASAEREAGLPELFLQALVREESAFDAQAVSWAGAYGLTQLLVSSARMAGRLMRPRMRVQRGEELLEPVRSARLGATLLAFHLRRFGHNLGLALAAYNAGDRVASIWWRRHGDDPFDIFAEEMTIKETRGYVRRVLRTYGIYRWMYTHALPRLAVPSELPPPS